MAYRILNHSYMCRTISDIRTYLKPNDIKPTGVVIPRGIVFTTNHDITINDLTFLQIEDYEPAKGMWVNLKSVEYMPIEADEEPEENTEFNDSVPYKESIVVNGKNTVIYDKWDSTTPIPGVLEMGSVITVDRKVDLICNGIEQTRYRITKVVTRKGESDDAPLGCWILGNYSVTVGEEHLVFKDPSLKVRATAASTAKTAKTSDSAARAKRTATTTTNTKTSTINSTTVVSTDDLNEEQMSTIINDSTLESGSDLYDMYGFDYMSAATDETVMGVPLGRLLFVHGMPFQFTAITDRRGNSKALYGETDYSIYAPNTSDTDNCGDFYGRVFTKEIAANMPIAVIVPGIPVFMTNIKQSLFGTTGTDHKVRKNWVPFWDDLTDTEFNSVLENLVNSSNGGEAYQYYSMQVDTTGYFQYVNALCQTSASLMGLDKVRYRGKKCSSFDWSKYNTSADQDYSTFEEVLGVTGGVSFAFDPLSSITDSLSNSTTESQFSGMLNSISAKAKELAFMTGTTNFGSTLFNESDYEAAVAQVSGGFMSGITNPISKISAFLKNSAHGLNVRFPEIWSDSSSTKSYDIDMKFITPYATAFCKWRYVLVPFFHVFALAAPHSDKSVVNYGRPFLIRAFSKGYFNVEMGMIKEVTWKRFGDGDMISEDGVPTEIDVSISFEDLYQQLAVSKFEGENSAKASYVAAFFNNTGLMDLVGTLSGVNMNRIGLNERLALYASSMYGAFSRTGSNLFSHASQRVRNITERFILGT